MNPFLDTLKSHGIEALLRGRAEILQVNIGKLCNLACHHCHVESGPKRTENMSYATARRVLDILEKNPQLHTLDLTGGAPELNPNFRILVAGARALGRRVLDRCNLTVLLLPGQEDTAQFLADHGVHIVASLPCYSKENVEKQRGRHVFDPSIEALQRLNALGYGQENSGLELDLVYNPGGAFLPPAQSQLELQYRKELLENFGIHFTHLLTITNMPIRRFAQDLQRSGKQEAYEKLLIENFNPATVAGLMCRNTLNVGYDGTLYDCDFNQALEMPLCEPRTKRALRLDDLDAVSRLDGNPIATAAHCFGCTAGSGSSCGGALSE